MVDVLITVCLVAVATKAALDAWFEGSVFATARAYSEAWKESNSKILSLVGELLTCRFCLGYHMAFIFSITACLFLDNWLLLILVAFAARGMEYEVERLLRRFDEPESK